MASAFTHAFFATALGTVMIRGRGKVIALGALFAVLPDTDVVGFGLGIPYAHLLGHRGLSHSIALAAGVAVALGWAISNRPRTKAAKSEPSRSEPNGVVPSMPRMTAYFFLAIASHGVLDALTDGGLGVAFFAPFSGQRFFFPWRPIAVSPISVERFLSSRGLEILANEWVVVWLPSFALAAIAFASRRRGYAPREEP